jgi:primosomal protein N' (replication factor Y) (superfamily II helicase)
VKNNLITSNKVYSKFMKIAQVITPNLGILDYLIPVDINIKVGDIVFVPFRNKLVVAAICKTQNHSDVPQDKLRNIEQVTIYSLSKSDLEFLHWVAQYYMFNIGIVFKMMLPNYIANFILKDIPYELSPNAIDLVYKQPDFNMQQKAAIEKIEKIIDSQNHNIILDGVTGSGKTEVYLASVSKILLEDKTAQILIMLPEISLTSQIIDRINKRFNYKPLIWHSSVSDKKKKDGFLKIFSGDARIIIGARSALFLPYKNLKMIIVDEEHDQSYKQEDGVTYQARDMAIMRGKLENIPVLLASASPSLESLYNVSSAKLSLVSLSNRYNDQDMPKIHIIDMKKEKRKNSFIAPSLLASLKENLLNNQQSLIFLNRKGYAPMLICKDCGHRVCCKNCSTGMVYHKSLKKLKCHQCGYVAAVPKKCNNCEVEEDSLVACGPGIERLDEEVSTLMPNARIVTLTQASFANSKEAEKLLTAIENREYDIILGTQIIAKGHHFPYLTLVGIIDADTAMMGGDLRCSEKNYQLLQQVSGRAGREIGNSKIFIQTYNPHHPLILALASYKRDEFISEELRNREAALMPPFGRLAAIIISSKQEKKLIEFTKNLIKIAPITKEIKVLGPAQALIYKIREKFRYRILLKTRRNINLQKYINAWLESIETPSHIHLKIDIDPYYFL